MGESLAASIGAKQSVRIRARLAGACQEFADLKYTTIQMNENYAAKMHVDGNNHGQGPGPRLCLRGARDAGGWTHARRSLQWPRRDPLHRPARAGPTAVFLGDRSLALMCPECLE